MKLLNYITSSALFCCILLLASCQLSEKKVWKPYSDALPNFHTLHQSLSAQSPEVWKRVTTDSSTVERRVTINWKDELRLFRELDINSVRNMELYQADTINYPLSNEQLIHLTPLAADAEITEVRYLMHGGSWQAAYVERSIENPFHTTHQHVWFVKDQGYRIDTYQEVSGMFEAAVSVVGFWGGELGSFECELDLKQDKLPFRLVMDSDQPGLYSVVNGGEIIPLQTTVNNDSVTAAFPVFQSELRFKLLGDSLQGTWHNLARGTSYVVPFSGSRQRTLNWKAILHQTPATSSKWEITFNDERTWKAVGLFNQSGKTITGSFLTETGDYRHLWGRIKPTEHGAQWTLSTFDGSHAYLFTGTQNDNKLSEGRFLSGIHYEAHWEGVLNPNFKLTNPNSITTLNPTGEPFQFSFPSFYGDTLTFPSQRFTGKVTLVSIMGSWCPNCMDESRLLTTLYETYHEEGLEVVGVAFERGNNLEEARDAVEKAIADMRIPYPVAYGGKANKQRASEAFPMLSGINSFPTLLFINREGQVVRIHSGFYGPGTGEYYTAFVAETKALIEQLL